MTQGDGGDSQGERDRQRQQIEQLLGFPGVGALAADTLAVNLGVPAGSLESVLATLERAGRVVRTADGRYALPMGRT